MENLLYTESFDELSTLLDMHGFKSGEIIFKLGQYRGHHSDYRDLIAKFITFNNVKIETSNDQRTVENVGKHIKKINHQELELIIKQTFSIKPNFTVIDIPFSDGDVKEIKQNF